MEVEGERTLISCWVERQPPRASHAGWLCPRPLMNKPQTNERNNDTIEDLHLQ